MPRFPKIGTMQIATPRVTRHQPSCSGTALLASMALALFIAACGDGATSATYDDVDGDLGSSRSDELNLTTGPPPTGDYQQNCSSCTYGNEVAVSGEAQTASLSTLVCDACHLDGSSVTAPALYMSVPSGSNLSYCPVPNGGGALVNCNCSDADCIADEITPPTTLASSDTTYATSCQGCNMLVAPTSGNGILACAACYDGKDDENKLTALALYTASPAQYISNCDGQILAKNNCPKDNWKAKLEKYLDDVWHHVKKVLIYILDNPPPTSTGTSSEDYFQLLAEGEEDTTGDEIVDAALTLLDGLADL